MKELDELKELLVGAECRDLQGLRTRLENPARRSRDLAEVLPEAVRLSAREGDRLANALQDPVGRCIRRSIARDTRTLADALFPVMGPAIRRSILETLRSFVQSINQAVEHSLSVRGLRWRWEAMRSGEPFAAVLLKHILVYRVEAAYLIHNASGLLVGHVVAATHTTLKDEDAVSAMLTAIEDFVKEAFSGVGEGGLASVEVGDRTLWLVKGSSASLACVISGVPPVELRERMEAILGEIYALYADELAAFRGDKSALPGAEDSLDLALALEYRDGAAGERRIALWPWVLALVLALGGLGWLWWQGHEQTQAHARRLADLRARLDAQPGILVVDWRPTDAGVAAGLLRDPLAADPARLVTDPALRGHVTFTETPFHSLVPALVLERARRSLTPPPGVELQLDGETLRARGSAPEAWLERAHATLGLPSGVSALDLAAVETDLSGLPAAVRAALSPPEGVTLSLGGRFLTIGGVAPWDWIGSVSERLRPLGLVSDCRFEGLEVEEWQGARTLLADIGKAEVLFGEGASPVDGSQSAIEAAAQALTGLQSLDERLSLALHVRVIGHSDGVGAEPWNQWLRHRRAVLVRDALVRMGVAPSLLSVEADPQFRPSPTPVPELRRVDFVVSAKAPAPPPCLR